MDCGCVCFEIVQHRSAACMLSAVRTGFGSWARGVKNGSGDQMAVQEVRGLLKNLLDTTDAKAVVLNLATVENLGADGLGMLVRFHGQARAKGIAFTLSNLTPTLREHVHLDGLDRLFTIVDDEAKALAAFANADQQHDPDQGEQRAMTDPTAEISSTTTMIAPQRRSVVRFVVACAMGLFVLSIIGASRGRFLHLIAEFEIAFSSMTSFALGIVLPIFLVIVVVATIAIELLAERHSVKNAWNATAICLALACLGAYIIGVSRPLMVLIEGLS